MTALSVLLIFILAALLGLAVTLCLQARAEVKSTQEDMVRVQQRTQADLARYQGITDLETYKAEIETKLKSARAYLPKFQSLAQMEQHKAQLTTSLEEFKQASRQWQEHIAAQQATLADLQSQSSAVEDNLQMQSFGFYHPKYGFEDSERYSFELAEIRDQQKTLVKSEEATHCPQEWTVDGSQAKGRKMVKEHAKLMLRAFNGECDAAIAKVKYNNVNNLETRLTRSFGAINKLGESKQLWVTQDYLNTKLKELFLVHEHREKVQEEREEQRRIKEEMREEEKALKEIEKAKKDAEREETAKTAALGKAREELKHSDGKQTDRLKDIVDRLEAELKDALERKAKAIARAQLTRSGHVYVLSNIGSFGEGIYKIGMTRRLEPLDRVRELGGASVPFRYDVHAMMYSEDAPALEHTLHNHFASKRVNFANERREFFRVSLDEIQEAVRTNFREVTFATVPDAEEYRRSLAIGEELTSSEGIGVEVPVAASV